MSLRVTGEVSDGVRKAALAAYPEECCGILIGAVAGDFDKPDRAVDADEIAPLPNGWESAGRTHRYAIDPKTIVAIEKRLSGTQRSIVGYYHSHPDVPAWPSPFDLLRAWPCYSYWILSVVKGKVASSRSWMRSEDGNSFFEEKLTGDTHGNTD